MAKKAAAPKVEKGEIPAVDKVEGPFVGKDKKQQDYEAEDAFRDILRAQEHQDNPELMERVKQMAKKKKKQINSIAGLKAKRDELIEKEDKGGEDED